MIVFNGYLFRFESITMVTDIRVAEMLGGIDIFETKAPIIKSYSFTIKCDGESVCFDYLEEEEANADRQTLTAAIYEYMDEHVQIHNIIEKRPE